MTAIPASPGNTRSNAVRKFSLVAIFKDHRSFSLQLECPSHRSVSAGAAKCLPRCQLNLRNMFQLLEFTAVVHETIVKERKLELQH